MNDITVIIPVSPVPSHPSSEVLDRTISSIQERLPKSEILLMFDDCPPWLIELEPAYIEFKKNMLWRIEHEMKNIRPMIFLEPSHQSTMMRQAVSDTTTPLILWSEQDTPLAGKIPFKKIAEVIKAGYANVVRFHFEAQVHPEHQDLMLDKEPINILGVPLLRTRQWSGRPHLASTAFYRQMTAKYWQENMFIEHFLYGPVEAGPFDEFRLHMYAPEGTLVRSLHLDGRRYGADEYDPRVS